MASLVTPLREAQLGGAQALLCDLAAALIDRGHDVTVYCAEGSEVPGLRLVMVPAPSDAAAALVMPSGPPPAALPSMRRAFSDLFEAVRAGAHEAVSQHAFDADAVELSAGLPVLHTLHLPPLVPLMVDAVRTTEARFVTVSEAMRLDWTRAGLGRVEVGVIPNGVPAFGLPSTEVRQRALIPGRVSPEKGTAVALRMARRTGLEPLLVGGVYDQDYWEREVQVPVEPVRRKELWELMAGSAVTLMPVDWEEPFGLVAAESQMAGCPVVAYRRGGLPEVVEDGVGGFLVVPGDEDAFAAAIGAARKLDRARVRASALRRLDIEVTAARYEEALVSLRRS